LGEVYLLRGGVNNSRRVKTSRRGLGKGRTPSEGYVYFAERLGPVEKESGEKTMESSFKKNHTVQKEGSGTDS